MGKKKDNFDIFEILLYIANNDIKGFENALKKYDLNINYNFKKFYEKYEWIWDEKPSKYKRKFDSYLEKHYKYGISLFDTQQCSDNQFTFLNVAIKLKKLNFCKYLLKHYKIYSDKGCALEFSIRSNYLKMFIFLYENYFSDYAKTEKIFYWSAYGGFNIFKYMVEEKQLDPFKYDIWRLAVYGSSIPIAKYLIEHDYYPTPKKLDFMLNSACDDGYDDMFEWMVKHLCKTKLDYKRALYAAFINHYYFEKPIWLFEYCAKKGVNINSRLKHYDMLIEEATRNSSKTLKVIDYMLKHNVNLKAKDRVGRTYLEYIYKHYIDDYELADKNKKLLYFKEIYDKLVSEDYYKKYKIRAYSFIPKDIRYDWNGNLIEDPNACCNVIEEI